MCAVQIQRKLGVLGAAKLGFALGVQYTSNIQENLKPNNKGSVLPNIEANVSFGIILCAFI